MKRQLFFGLLAMPFVSMAQVTDPAPYCSGAFDNENGASTNYISSVSIGTLNNVTGTTASSGGHYRYYNNLEAPVLTKGEEYEVIITGDNANGVVGHFLAVYFDFNQDDDFDDAGERVMHYDFLALEATSIATIEIPLTAATGVTRMRVILFEDDDYTWMAGNEEATPCTVYNNGLLDWGETEDYDVNLQVAAGVREEGAITAFCFPNPASDKLSVRSDSDDVEYAVYDRSGALVLKGRINSELENITISSLAEGIYMIRIYQDGKILQHQSFIKI